jgi:hypothetical protein
MRTIAGEYLETTRAFWQPYAERELTREDAAKWPATSLAFLSMARFTSGGGSSNGANFADHSGWLGN